MVLKESEIKKDFFDLQERIKQNRLLKRNFCVEWYVLKNNSKKDEKIKMPRQLNPEEAKKFLRKNFKKGDF